MHAANVLVENNRTMIASPVSTVECDDLREWLCYIKPLGPGMTVTAREAPDGEIVFRVHIAGTEPTPSDDETRSACTDHDSAVCRPRS